MASNVIPSVSALPAISTVLSDDVRPSKRENVGSLYPNPTPCPCIRVSITLSWIHMFLLEETGAVQDECNLRPVFFLNTGEDCLYLGRLTHMIKQVRSGLHAVKLGFTWKSVSPFSVSGCWL